MAIFADRPILFLGEHQPSIDEIPAEWGTTRLFDYLGFYGRPKTFRDKDILISGNVVGLQEYLGQTVNELVEHGNGGNEMEQFLMQRLWANQDTNQLTVEVSGAPFPFVGIYGEPAHPVSPVLWSLMTTTFSREVPKTYYRNEAAYCVQTYLRHYLEQNTLLRAQQLPAVIVAGFNDDFDVLRTSEEFRDAIGEGIESYRLGNGPYPLIGALAIARAALPVNVLITRVWSE